MDLGVQDPRGLPWKGRRPRLGRRRRLGGRRLGGSRSESWRLSGRAHGTGVARGQAASWRWRAAGRLVCACAAAGVGGAAARSARRPGINGSISGREGGALAAATASGSHYHRRQRLHRRRLDRSPPRRLLRPHPVPCSRFPPGPRPGNPRLHFGGKAGCEARQT